MRATQLNPFYYLNWLLRHWKQIPIPVLVLYPNCQYSGYYCWPDDSSPLFDVEGVELPIPNGAIVIDSDNPGTIAHEFRHHLQFLRLGTRYDCDLSNLNNGRYWDQAHERDALMFERTMAPDPLNELFYDRARLCNGQLSRSNVLAHVPLVQ